MALPAVGRKTQLLSILLLKHISRAGVGAMEVETASGHVLGARSIRQAMADANLYAEGTTFGSNRILALCFTFSIAAPFTGSCAPTHVAKIHNECAAQIRPCTTRGEHCLVRGGWGGAIGHAYLAVNAFSVCGLLPDRNEQCQVERALDCPMTWHPRCLFAMV